MKALHAIAFILVIVGGLNWLLFGLFSLDVVSYLGTTLANIVYILVGISAIYLLVTHKKDCMCCKKEGMMMDAPKM